MGFNFKKGIVLNFHCRTMHSYRLPWQRPGLVGHVVSGQPLFPQLGMDLSKFYSMRPPTVDKPQDQEVQAADKETPAGSTLGPREERTFGVRGARAKSAHGKGLQGPREERTRRVRRARAMSASRRVREARAKSARQRVSVARAKSALHRSARPARREQLQRSARPARRRASEEDRKTPEFQTKQ